MTLEKFINDFADLFPDLSPDELKPETKLAALPQWDSLGVLLVISYADEHFDRQLAGTDLQKCKDFNELFELVVPG